VTTCNAISAFTKLIMTWHRREIDVFVVHFSITQSSL